MNKERRRRLNELQGKIEEIVSIIEDVQGEEQDAYDNLPENMRDGDKGQAMDAAIDEMNNAVQSLNEALSSIESAQE